MVDLYIPSEKLYIRLRGKNKAQFQKGEVEPCCKQPENLRLGDREPGGKINVWTCQVCKRAHYVLNAEPGRFGIVMK